MLAANPPAVMRNRIMKMPAWSSIRPMLSQALVIVVSVLLALLADAWWDNHKAEARAMEHIASLTRDFDQMEARLGLSIQSSQSSIQAGSLLLNDLSGGTSFTHSDSAYTLISSVLNMEVFAANTSGYDALVASSDFQLIDNSELKQELAHYYGFFDDLRVTEDGLGNFMREFAVKSTISRLIKFDQMLEGGGMTHQEYVQLSESQELRSNMAVLLFLHISALEDYHILKESLERLSAMVRELDY